MINYSRHFHCVSGAVFVWFFTCRISNVRQSSSIHWEKHFVLNHPMMIMSQFRFMSKTLAATPFATRKQGKPSYYVNLALPLAADIAEPDNNLRMTPRPIGGIRILSANVMEIDGVMGDTVPHKEQIGETEWSGVAFWKLTWGDGWKQGLG